MSPNTPTQLADLLAAAHAVLLDFDGPVCAVFSGHPAPGVAEHLRQILTRHGHHLPEDITATRDPLHVVHRTADIAPDLITDIEAALTAAELRAVTTATATPDSAEVLAACQATERPVIIVSNNSAAAVAAYLDQHELAPLVRHIQGRDSTDPGLMKPNPYPILQALATLNLDAKQVVLIGDSRTDIDAAHAAGCPVIAYANKPHKIELFTDADALTTSMHPVAEALTT
jgi:phosphoglycolate phosphatase